MPRRARADLRALDDLAYAQSGVVTAAQLVAVGLPSSTLRHRARTGGPWRRVLPGTYLLTNGEPTVDQRRAAALLYAGADACITGAEALRLDGVRRARDLDASVQVLVPHLQRRQSAGFVIVERTIRMPDVVQREGHPCAAAPRAYVDAARRLTALRDVEALLADGVQSGRVTVGQLVREQRAGQRRGSALVNDAIRALAAGVRSAAEAQLRRAWLESGLDEPLWNRPLFDRSGRFIAQPDAYVPDAGVAVEVDSKEHHLLPADWAETMARHGRMSEHGLVVLHVPPSRIDRDAPAMMREISTTVKVHSGRQLPDIRVA
jgi:hypothetical protein